MGKDVLSYNKLVEKTRKLVIKHNVPKHWSKTQNEKFDVHIVCILFVLFQIEQKDYRLFSGWLSITTALGLPDIPHWTTIEKAFKRLPPRLVRSLLRLSGKCKDRILALDPTYYQLTNPSKGYCRRIGRDPRKDKLRKVSVIVTTNTKKVLDIVVRAKERHGMKDVLRFSKELFRNRTTLADKEFDAESFHQYLEDCGGRSFVPLRNNTNVPYHRIKGMHRKTIYKKGIPRVYRFRVASESNNSAVKRRFSSVLKGKKFWTQARDLYGKYLAYNLSQDCYLRLRTFYRAY